MSNHRYSPSWIAVALAVFLADVLFHLPVTDVFDELATRFGFFAYDRATRHVFVALGAAGLSAAWLWPSGRRLTIGTATAVLVMMAALAQAFIVVASIENIHYPQYALLMILLALGLPRLDIAWLGAVALGAADEFYQAVALPRGTPGYFDWNDVVLNGIGATFGLVILLAVARSKPSHGPVDAKIRYGLPAILLGLALVLFAPAWPPFYDVTPGGRLFYRLSGFEGMLGLTVLWWGGCYLLSRPSGFPDPKRPRR